MSPRRFLRDAKFDVSESGKKSAKLDARAGARTQDEILLKASGAGGAFQQADTRKVQQSHGKLSIR